MKIMPIFGTRPEAIKMAPVVKALQNDPDIDCVFVSTGQHREMLDQVLELFSITPDYDLRVMEENQTLEKLSAKILVQLTPILEKEKPDLVLVHGDTSTTLMGALAAFYKQIPVGHVEAGLRTYNTASPFPEEANRQLVGRIATFHFAATNQNKQNLVNEHIHTDNIAVVGNTVIDALLYITEKPFTFSGQLQEIVSNGKKTVLVTTHRRENLNELKNVYGALNRLLETHEDIQIVFPVHLSPSVRVQVGQYLQNSDRVHLIDPLDYESFSNVMKQSHLIITDSGGIQEEAPALNIPVLVARNTTEREEGVVAGTLKLVGTDETSIFNEANHLLTNKEAYKKMASSINPFGSGDSSQQILAFIKNNLNKKTE